MDETAGTIGVVGTIAGILFHPALGLTVFVVLLLFLWLTGSPAPEKTKEKPSKDEFKEALIRQLEEKAKQQ